MLKSILLCSIYIQMLLVGYYLKKINETLKEQNEILYLSEEERPLCFPEAELFTNVNYKTK